MTNLTPKQIKNFMSKITQSRNCWIWKASKNTDGYGHFGLNGKIMDAHSVSYMIFKEDIP